MRASGYRKLPSLKDASPVQDTYKFFSDSALAVGEQLNRIGNEIYAEANVPATSILSRHSSAFERNVDDLVRTAERYQFILSIHAHEPNNKTEFISDTLDFVEQAKRAKRQILALLLLPFKEDELKIRKLNVQNEVRRIAMDLYALFSEHDCDPDRAIQAEATSTIRTDQTLFTIAVSNVLANSVVHAGRGRGLRIRVYEAELSTLQVPKKAIEREREEQHSQYLNLVIADNGPGISVDEHCDVFHLFKQGRSGQAKKMGSGVGLTFARFAMELLGGSLTIMDSADPGAAFLLRFPVRQ
jgi:signal transduction histidine kinase